MGGGGGVVVVLVRQGLGGSGGGHGAGLFWPESLDASAKSFYE